MSETQAPATPPSEPPGNERVLAVELPGAPRTPQAGWFERNIPAFAAVFGLALLTMLVVVLLQLLPAQAGANPYAAHTLMTTPPPFDLESLKPEQIMKSPVLVAATLLRLLGAGVFVVLVLVLFISPDARAWLKKLLPAAPLRYLPAVRGMDVCAGIVAYGGAHTLLGGLTAKIAFASPGSQLAALVASNALAMGCAVWMVILLARLRGHGSGGAQGLLPFWTLPPSPPGAGASALQDRPLWVDVAYGLGAYVLATLPMLLVQHGSQWMLQAAGMKKDQHPLIGVLLGPLEPHNIAVILVCASLGAALFEELLFRGGIYNALCRVMPKAAAALLGAVLFSAVHFIAADFLALMLMGLIMTWLYEHTGRLVASITFHFANNFISLLSILALRGVMPPQ